MPHPVVESLLRRWFANVVIVCTLSLGLGALAVMAALVGAVLFPRVPFTTPERLAVLWGSNRPGAEQPADYLTRQRADRWLAAPPRSLDRLAAYGSTIGMLQRERSSHRVNVTAVSGSFFHVLGVKDVRGRVLMAYDSTHAASPALILSDRAWRKYFHSNPAVIGQVVPVDSTFYTVVGIAPAEFDLPRATDVWVMRASLPAHRQPAAWLLLGRLRDGVTLATARADVIQRSRVENRSDSVAYAGQGVTAVPVGQQERRLGAGLLPLITVCLLALYLIAAMNIGTLLLLQTTARAREFAIRAALGAGLWRALRPLLAEMTALFALGGSLALLGALAVLRVLRKRFLFEQAPLTVRAEWTVLAAILLLGVGTLALLVPLVARRVHAADLFGALRRSGETVTGDVRDRRVRLILAGAQIALAVVLACTAGIVGRSLHHYRAVDMGFDTERVVIARPDYDVMHYDHERQVVVAEAVRLRLQGAPGIARATYWRRVPVAWPPPPRERVFALGGRTVTERDMVWWHYEVGPQFLETLNAPLLQGRDFDSRDRPGSLPVAIINREAAERWWPGESAVGRRVSLNPTDAAAWLTIVGVADVIGIDQHFDRDMVASERKRPQLFRPAAQAGPAATPYHHWSMDCFICPRMAIAARASNSVDQIRSEVRRALRDLEPDLPVAETLTMFEEQTTDYTGSYLRVTVRTVGVFALLAALLAILGVYGVVATTVAARTRELAIRTALGATATRLRGMLLREHGLLAVLAVTVGTFLYHAVQRLAGHLLFGGASRFLLFGKSALDATVIVPVLLLCCAMIGLATLAGGHRALTQDPRAALQAE